MINKTLKQIQEENRKIIILANNPEAKSYDEALEHYQHPCYILGDGKAKDDNDNIMTLEENCRELFLSEVLIALNYNISLQEIATSSYGIWVEKIIYFTECKNIEIICDWDLTKPTLEQQSEETQREINKILIKK